MSLALLTSKYYNIFIMKQQQKNGIISQSMLCIYIANSGHF